MIVKQRLSDSDSEGNLEDRKSTSKYAFYTELYCCYLVIEKATHNHIVDN